MPLFGPNSAALKEKRDLAGLLLALKGSDWRARGEAAKALGELGAHSALPAIAAMLLAPDSKLGERISAAEALGKIGDAAALDALSQAITHSRARERAFIEAATNDPERKHSINLIINRIAADEYTLRSASAIALGRIGGERAIRALFDIIVAESGWMAANLENDARNAIRDAVMREGERFAPLLREMLKHASVEVRQWAAHCLGDIGSEEAVKALLETAYDENEDFLVRETALHSLGSVGDRRVIPYLEDLLASGNRAIARDAHAALTNIRQRFPLKLEEEN